MASVVLIQEKLNQNESICLIAAINIWYNQTNKKRLLLIYRMYCNNNIVDFLLFQTDVAFLFNPHMHKLGPQGPTHYIFGD